MSSELSDLDILYSPSKWSKRATDTTVAEEHVKIITKYSEAVEKEIQCDLNIPYGTGERELINIYGTDLDDEAPIFIHIHGGYWQMTVVTHRNNSFMAKNLYKNNIKSMFIDYELCPKVTLQEIVQNIQKAIRKCLQYAKKHNARGIYLSGHSAGAHLVALLFENFIPSLPKEDQKLFKTAFLLSGVYDLVPFSKTKLNIPVKLDETLAKALSPLFKNLSAGEGGTIFYVVVGEHDSPAFEEQAKKMNGHLISLGIGSHYLFVKNVDHFDLIERFIDEDFELTKLIINVINN